MSIDLNEVTPQDSYIVRLTKPINQNQLNYLLELYQPIIGLEAVSFYLTLINQLPIAQFGNSGIKLHRQLMGQMNTSFKEIISARKVLEAVGLLRSFKYKHKDREEYVYEYLIIPPLYPAKFFQSDILSVLLLNRVGNSQFKLIREKYFRDMNWSNDLYLLEKEITKSFDEVFDSILASELRVSSDSELAGVIQPLEGKELTGKGIVIKSKYLDIDFIKGMVSELYMPQQNLTDRVVELLNELAFLYQLSDLDIINLLKDHMIYDNAGKIDEKLLRKRIHERYQFEQKEVILFNKEKPVTLPGKAEQQVATSVTHQSTTAAAVTSATANQPPAADKAKRHKWMLENFTPIELMEQYQGGGKIPDADLTIIESLLHDFKLSYGVVNVLIEYVMLTNDYKLPKKLTEKIAGHWKRLNVKTVDEALAVAKKEHQLYKDWKDPNKANVPTAKRSKQQATKGKKERIPDYILQQEEKYHNKEEKNGAEEINQDKKAKIDKLLKDLGEI